MHSTRPAKTTTTATTLLRTALPVLVVAAAAQKDLMGKKGTPWVDGRGTLRKMAPGISFVFASWALTTAAALYASFSWPDLPRVSASRAAVACSILTTRALEGRPTTQAPESTAPCLAAHPPREGEVPGCVARDGSRNREHAHLGKPLLLGRTPEPALACAFFFSSLPFGRGARSCRAHFLLLYMAHVFRACFSSSPPRSSSFAVGGSIRGCGALGSAASCLKLPLF